MNKCGISWVLGPDGAPGFSWNPFAGCARDKVSPGCAHCYAERLAATRLAHLPAYAGLAKMVHRATGVGGGFEDAPTWSGEVRFFPEKLAEPLRRRKPTGIFVGDMGDVALLPFHEIAAIFGVMAACPQHRFYVLTKRPERLLEWFAWFAGFDPGKKPRDILRAFVIGTVPVPYSMPAKHLWPRVWPLPNVWVGASASTQKDLDRVVPELEEIPAAVRFLSLEPLLSKLSLNLAVDLCIVGGESGPHARPYNVDWIRSIVLQCADAGTACWVKQIGANALASVNTLEVEAGLMPSNMGPRGRAPEPLKLRDRAGADPSEWPEDLRVRQMPEVKS